jgi:polysaccharide chain length determinant protein (PEP-CTERM system associated)
MDTSLSTTGYVAISRRTLDLEDYIDVARRHVGWIMGPTFFGIVASIVVAFVIPNTYVSQAEMQITPSQISPAIVQNTISQLLTDRISAMENNILSRTSLSSIIQDPRLNLYDKERQAQPLEDVIETMRTRDVRIQIVSLPSTGGARASAFTVSFSYKDPHKAHDTVQALITKFQDANLTEQRTQQNVLDSFVHDELSEAKANLDKLSEELTKFRIENQGKLPEQTDLNMAQLNSLQGQANGANDALNRLEQDKLTIQTHLQTLQSQMDLMVLYQKEEDASVTPALARQNERLAVLNRTITDMETNLAQLKLIYTPNYPDIKDLENRLKLMRAERDHVQADQLAEDAKPQTPAPKKNTNTNYAAAQSITQLQGQIDATNAQLKNLEMQRDLAVKNQASVQKAISGYQERLAATSAIEAHYADLERDTRTATEKYQSLLAKQQLAEQNGDLLQRKAGETLDVLDPPSLPTQPSKPNRWMIVGAGSMIGFILGLAMAGFHEAKDTSLKNLKDVRAYTNVPVLSSIPLLENTMLVQRKKRLAYLAWAAAVIVGAIAISAALFYHAQYLA